MDQVTKLYQCYKSIDWMAILLSKKGSSQMASSAGKPAPFAESDLNNIFYTNRY